MKLLTTAAEFTSTLRDLMRRFDRYRWSVAWASVGFALYDELLQRQDRIEQLVVGTHFYQTHPDFLDAFHGHSNVRFVLQPDGVFHPKLYLFETDADKWSCIVGSANFTGGAFSSNVEVGVLFDSEAPRARETYRALTGTLARHWKTAAPTTSAQIERYRHLWKRNRDRTQKLSGKFGTGAKGKPLVDVPLFGLSWPTFVRRVRAEKGHALRKRLAVLAAIGRLFQTGLSFSALSADDRRKVAGFAPEKEMQWRYFGSMVGAGRFKHAVNSNDTNLAAALDGIPLEGLVTNDRYRTYVESFRKAFPKGGDGIAVATRLLCMKRPDMFLCFDSKNRRKLCEEFGIAQSNMSYERYWEQVIERVRETEWWNSSCPASVEEGKIWRGRTALLDSLYYEPKA